MKFGLNQNTINKIHAVFEKHPEIETVLIYGSRAKGNYREGSDIDISLKGKHLNESIRSKIFREIDELNTPYLFDISIYKEIDSEELKAHIDRAGKVFYQNHAYQEN